MRTTVVVIDDHTVLAELLMLAVHGQPDFDVVGHAQSVASGMTMVDEVRPDMVIMDVRLGDGDGIAATAALTARHPALRVVILTAYADHVLVSRAVAADACALLPKDGDLAGMLAVLRTADRGAFSIHPRLVGLLTARAVPGQDSFSLTPREQEVLRLLATGLDTRLIAREAGISLHTCRGHVKNILSKLDAHSQLEAVAKAMRAGLIDIDVSG